MGVVTASGRGGLGLGSFFLRFLCLVSGKWFVLVEGGRGVKEGFGEGCREF